MSKKVVEVEDELVCESCIYYREPIKTFTAAPGSCCYPSPSTGQAYKWESVHCLDFCSFGRWKVRTPNSPVSLINGPASVYQHLLNGDAISVLGLVQAIETICLNEAINANK